MTRLGPTRDNVYVAPDAAHTGFCASCIGTLTRGYVRRDRAALCLRCDGGPVDSRVPESAQRGYAADGTALGAGFTAAVTAAYRRICSPLPKHPSVSPAPSPPDASLVRLPRRYEGRALDRHEAAKLHGLTDAVHVATTAQWHVYRRKVPGVLEPLAPYRREG